MQTNEACSLSGLSSLVNDNSIFEDLWIYDLLLRAWTVDGMAYCMTLTWIWEN